jgi:hypothetical protein
MKPIRFIAATAFLFAPGAMMGCHSSSPTTQAAPATDPSAKVYPPAPEGSPFALIKVGMDMKQVTDLIGPPTDAHAYATGKAFIPFYYGGDTHRTEYEYKGQGRVIFSPDSRFSSGQSVVEIQYDPTETGYGN